MNINIEELRESYAAKKNISQSCPFHLRKEEYREHYPLIKQAVQEGMALRTVITIYRERGAWPDKKAGAIHAAYRRALLFDGIKLGNGEDGGEEDINE